jgi:RNA polymerase sigma-70 factor (sigma-E family)
VTRRNEADGEFGRFVLEANAGLVRFGTFLVGERAGGEDVTQTALLKVYGSWSRLEDTAAAGAYTRKVMVRLAERGRRRRWSGEHPSAIAADALITLDRTDEVVVADLVRRALACLPVGQRAVLVLRYFEMRNEAEIAEILGISIGTVKSRAARGLAALREVGLLRSDQLTGEDAR